MAKVKVELNPAGVRELLRSPEMVSVCQEYANTAISKLGSGYESTTRIGRNRCNADIAAVTIEAKIDNLKNNSILKAL